MKLLIGSDVVVVFAGALVVWLVLSFALRGSTRRQLAEASTFNLPDAAARFAAFSALRTVLGIVLSAGVILFSAAAIMQWHLSELGTSESALNTVVSYRDYVERALDLTKNYSIGLWLAALCVLAFIWVSVKKSGARKRWSAAVEQRRKTLESSLADLSEDELRLRAKTADSFGVQELDRKCASVLARNEKTIEEVSSLEIIQFGEDEDDSVSLNDLRALEHAMRASAEASPVSSDEDPDADDAELANPDDLLQSAESLQAQICELEKGLPIELVTLDGEITTTLADARSDPLAAVGMETETARALREIIVEGQIREHESEGFAKRGREPEMLREWVAAGATGEAAVRGTSWVGRQAGRVFLLALMLATIGLGAHNAIPGAILLTKAFELRIGADIDRANLSASFSADEQSDDDTSSTTERQLASDSVTANSLRHAFRASAIRSLMRANTGGSTRMLIRAQQQFELAAVEARQRILLASSRDAAPALAARRGGTQIVHAHVPPAPTSAQSMSSLLDESIERRIQTLRAHELTWARLRASAVRPVHPDLVAEHLLKVAFAGDRAVPAHTMRAWSDRASGQFAKTAAAQGRIPTSSPIEIHFGGSSGSLTSRDKRLIADFKAEVPQRVEARLNGVRSGRIDPGSLHRGVPGSSYVRGRPYIPPRAAVSASAYAQLFPAVASEAVSSSLASSTSSSNVRRTRTRVAARSYGRIRFSGRVGGVVIGREPDESNGKAVVHGFEWSIGSNKRVTLSLQTDGGKRIVLGPFHPAIVHHALAYAADGRVVTSTLPQPVRPQDRNVFHVNARRVVVHPAFEDTAFACPAIQIDRFVDGFTAGEPITSRKQKIGLARQGVTVLGRVLQNYRVTDPEERKIVVQWLENLGQYAKTCAHGKTCFPIEDYEQAGLSFGAAKKVIQCAASGQRAEQCLDFLKKNKPDASYAVDSGVREVRYKLDPELAFLTGAGQEGNALWPLDFIIQAVPQSLRGKDMELKSDSDPWTFPAISSDIRTAVQEGVAGNPNARRVLQDMKAFVVLQRLFRNALDGNLGYKFPLSELAAMQTATAPFVKVVRHERWNINGPWMQTVRAMEQFIVEQLEEIASDLTAQEQCSASANRMLQAAKSAPWPNGPSFWKEIGDLPEKCFFVSAATNIGRLLETMSEYELVDEALHVTESLSKQHAVYHCGPL